MFCLSPHSTHLLQPLDVGLLGPLQHHYRKTVEDFLLTNGHGINWVIFFPIYKLARAKAYTVENIKATFKVTGILPLNPRVVLSQLAKPTAQSRSQSNSTTCILERTPYSKHDLRQQTQYALNFIKTASEGETCGWILRFAHAAEHSLTEADLARTELQRLRNKIKNIRPSKKDMRQFGRAQQYGIMTGSQILSGIRSAMTGIMPQKQKRQILEPHPPPTGPLLQQSEKPHQFLLPPSDLAFECAFGTSLSTLLGPLGLDHKRLRK